MTFRIDEVTGPVGTGVWQASIKGLYGQGLHVRLHTGADGAGLWVAPDEVFKLQDIAPAWKGWYARADGSGGERLLLTASQWQIPAGSDDDVARQTCAMALQVLGWGPELDQRGLLLFRNRKACIKTQQVMVSLCLNVLAPAWQLDESTVQVLFELDETLLQQWRADRACALPAAALWRMDQALSMHELQAACHRGRRTALEWMRQPITAPPCDGRCALEYLMEQGGREDAWRAIGRWIRDKR